PLLQYNLAPGLFQVTAVQVLREIAFVQLPIVEQLEEQTVGQDRLEDFRQIERERKPTRARLVQETDRRVELGAVDLRQRRRIDETIGERDERVHHVIRRATDALRKIHFVAQDTCERLIVSGARTPFACHQLFHTGNSC